MTIVNDSIRLKKLINSKGSPVAVKYQNEISKGDYQIEEQVICQSILDAVYGKKMAITEKNSNCKGGSYFLGLLEYDPKVCNFWTDIERSHLNLCTAASFIRNTPQPPVNLADYICLSPIEQCDTTPDLVIFICTPAQAARLLGLHIFKTGRPSQIYSYTAACAAAIGIPMVTGDLHVSFIDNSAREIAQFQDDELIVTIPAQQISLLSSSIEECIWGEADAPYKAIEKRLKGKWQRIQ